MYAVILNVYSESGGKKGIHIKEKLYSNGPFISFDEAQQYMNLEIRKKQLMINDKTIMEIDTNVNRDRASIGFGSSMYYKCYDYHIKSI